MKILFLYTHNKSFLASFFYEIAVDLLKCGHSIKIFSLKKSNSNKNLPAMVEVAKKGNYISNGLKIYKVIKKNNPDVVISNFSYVNAALVSGKFLGVKKNIVWYHTLSKQINPYFYQTLLKSKFLSLASSVIVNSELLKQDLIQNYNQSENKIFPIPFWSTAKRNNITKRNNFEEPLKIGCPGRLEEVKNQSTLLKVFASMSKDIDSSLYFAGNGSDLSILSKMSEDLKIQNRTEFLGVLKIEEMQTFYNEMDIVVLPSRFEAFGLVLIEALSMGCPVLVSQKFGALNFIEDQEFLKKYTFDPFNSMDLQTKLESLFNGKIDDSDYFINIYNSSFQKDKIVKAVEKVINA